MKNPHYNPLKPHHRPDGFQNTYQSFRGKRWHELLRWRWQAWRQGHPKAPSRPIPVVAPELDFVHANARAGLGMQPAATWIGHITVLAQIGGLNILTDPVFSERCAPVQWAGPRRHTPPGLTLAQLPRIDVVLLSHNHYDHMDEASLVALGQQAGGPPLFIMPLGHKAWFARRGIHHVVELDWWDTHVLEAHTLGPAHARIPVTLTPAQHWSARTPTDALRSLWGGFAVQSPDCHLFFAGDTAYSKDFVDIRQHFARSHTPELGGGFDLALLPIGAYEPRWFMKDQHVNPEEAVQIFHDLGCKQAMAVHWGCFQLTDEPLDEPPRALARALKAAGTAPERFAVLAVGETMRVQARGGAIDGA
ncbi:MBL fold metallo-hydrolase [Aquabacterium sp.]|jgi:N-acyl-phosphatidylethanolamine-hydrolysing phospholipase D|uniref:MBL fold metallo-hydrolase n=1 Tax=Aquabacterium sp. TaxID=1872578 RepID=UPI0025B7C142|nr:MBL fold metallo-hydrolase [Aquabacterium sp.]